MTIPAILRIVGFTLVAAGAGYLLYQAYMYVSWFVLLSPSSVRFSPTLATMAPLVVSVALIFLGGLLLGRAARIKGQTRKD